MSLFDTGADGYLRQSDDMMLHMLPSRTIINTAGPDQLAASVSGMLNLLVKDQNGNTHQVRVANALVVPDYRKL